MSEFKNGIPQIPTPAYAAALVSWNANPVGEMPKPSDFYDPKSRYPAIRDLACDPNTYGLPDEPGVRRALAGSILARKLMISAFTVDGSVHPRVGLDPAGHPWANDYQAVIPANGQPAHEITTSTVVRALAAQQLDATAVQYLQNSGAQLALDWQV